LILIKEPITPNSFYFFESNEDTFKINELSELDFQQFLSNFFTQLNGVANIYCFCLLPHHISILIKTKSEKEIFTYFKIEGKFPEETTTLDDIKNLSLANGMQHIDILGIHLTKQFAHFFNGFGKNIIPQKANFITSILRTRISEINDLQNCITQIHFNAINGNKNAKYADWKYSSYNAILSEKPTKLLRNEVIELFDGVENFIAQHKHE